MARETEQRLIAYLTLVVVGVATTGWAAWILATAGSRGDLEAFLLGSAGVVALSVPAGPLAAALGVRGDRDWAMVARRVTLLAVLGLLAGVLILLLAGPGAALLPATVTGVLALWVLVPLAVGALSSTTGGTSARSILLAWPATNVLSLAVIAAPTPAGIGVGPGPALALAEPARSAALLGTAAFVGIGPVVLGKVLDRISGRVNAGAR